MLTQSSGHNHLGQQNVLTQGHLQGLYDIIWTKFPLFSLETIAVMGKLGLWDLQQNIILLTSYFSSSTTGPHLEFLQDLQYFSCPISFPKGEYKNIKM